MSVAGRAIAILAGTLLSPCRAQADPWERLRLVEPGKTVHVKLRSGKTVKAKLDSWSSAALSVRQGKNGVTLLDRADVLRVAVPMGMSRGRRAGWAALIGGGAGAGLGGGICAAASDCDVAPAAIAAGSALWVGGIAAGVAALIPRHKEVVYSAVPAPATTSRR